MDKDFSRGAYLDPRFQTKTDRLQDLPTTVWWNPETKKYERVKPRKQRKFKEPTHIAYDDETKKFVERTGTLPTRPLKSEQKKAQRERLASRDGWKCFWCDCELSLDVDPKLSNHKGRKGQPRYPTIDHVIERAHGGSNRDENCVLSCGPCNNARNKTFMERVPDEQRSTNI